MPSFNKVMLIGRLTRDPEMKYTGSGLGVCRFSIAVDRRFKDQSGERKTDFFNCTTFRQTAEYVNSYVKKGRLVAVEGRVEIDEGTGQDGQPRRYISIVCDQVEALDAQRDQAGPADPAMGGFAGGGRQSAPPQDDNGYYEEEAPQDAPPPARRPAPNANANAQAPAAQGRGGAGAPARGAGGAGAGGGQGAPARGAAPQARSAQRPPAQPTYPDDDFDDSDPFGDE